MPRLSRSRLIILGAAALIILLLVVIVLVGRRNPADREPIRLTFWGVVPENAMEPAIESLGERYEVSYRAIPVARYEAELVDALASGRGPDVFMVHSSWIPRHFDKLVPVSEEQLSLKSLETFYPTVIEQDFAPDGVIFALPLYLDTLALLYNRDLFDGAAIATPPATWTDFQAAVKRLRILDSSGRIIRAGAAIGGTSRSIPEVKDVLSVLMMQSGVPMVESDFSRATFASRGAEALSFYAKFANAGNEFYTWTESFGASLDAFSGERVAMIFGYAADLPRIRERNVALPIAVAPLPKPASAVKEVNYANYWGVAVSNRNRAPRDAWSFILGMTANPTVARALSQATGLPPALRSLIGAALNDPVFGVFAEQALSARSWPQADPEEVSRIFSAMVEAVLAGRETAETAIRQAEEAVTALMRERRTGF